MEFLKKGLTAIGRLLIVGVLAATFLVGVLGVSYLQLKGEEIEIPKIVGKNFNEGQDELEGYGLRIKKIASRYSEEKPNTILEQRPRAGSTAKSGLMISVVVSQENPDGTEAPADVKEDEDAIEEIEDLPELKTDKPKKKKKTKPKKTSAKTRDVIEEKGKEGDKVILGADTSKGGDSKTTAKSGDKGKNSSENPAGKKTGPAKTVKPKDGKTSPKAPKKPKPKPAGDSRPRKAGKSN